jgi:hypothetical protein
MQLLNATLSLQQLNAAGPLLPWNAAPLQVFIHIVQTAVPLQLYIERSYATASVAAVGASYCTSVPIQIFFAVSTLSM